MKLRKNRPPEPDQAALCALWQDVQPWLLYEALANRPAAREILALRFPEEQEGFMPAKSDQPRRVRHGGFSLIELLVVIGVIGVLIALLMPALRVARESANRTKCAAQLRQIGYAFNLYCNANQGWLPAWSGWHTWPPGLPEDSDGPVWTIELMPYIGNPDSPIYNCPSFPGHMRNYFISAIWSSVNGRNAMKLTDVKLSSRFILSGDITQVGVYPYPYGTSQYTTADADYSDEGEPLLAFPAQGGFLMHRGGNNILFDDTHVEAFAAFDPVHMSFDPTRALSWQQVHDDGADDPTPAP